MENPKKDILSVIFCDVSGENCINPEFICKAREIYTNFHKKYK
jgi:hypothetical protein